MSYDFKTVEEKWQKIWEQHPPAKTKPAGSGKKFYCLDMFPYPSGSGSSCRALARLCAF